MGASVAGPIERQLSTIAGITSLTSTSSLGLTTIIIQFDLNRNIDGAALDVQTALTVAARRLPIEMTTPPYFPQGQSGRFLDPAVQPGVADAAAVDRRRLWPDHAGAADFPAAGHRSGAGVRVAEIRRPRPGRSDRGGGARHLARRRAQRRRQGELQHAGRHHRRAQPEHHHHGERRDAACRRVPDVVVAYRNGLPIKISEVANGGRCRSRTTSSPICTTTSGRSCWRSSSSRTPIPSRSSTPSASACRVYRAQIPAAVKMEILADRSMSIREAVEDVQVTLVIADRAGRDGDLPVPALGGRRPSFRRSRCRSRSSPLAR